MFFRCRAWQRSIRANSPATTVPRWLFAVEYLFLRDRLERLSLVRFHYFPATFEGPNAESSLLEAFNKALALHDARPLDAIAIVRGGGGRQGLMSLSTELLARTICLSPVPVLTGIGHADDEIFLDEMCWRSFDTPSKVIGFIRDTVRDRAQAHEKAFQEMTTNARLRIRDASNQVETFGRTISNRITRERSQLATASHEVETFLHRLRDLGPRCLKDVRAEITQKLESLCDKAKQNLATATSAVKRELGGTKIGSVRLLSEAGKDVDSVLTNIRHQSRNLVNKAYQDTERLMTLSLALGPEKTIQRGFPLALQENDKPITTAVQAKAAGRFCLKFRDDNISVTTKGT